MAGLQINPTEIATARAAGYSDDEIVGYLSERSPEQFKAASDAGYSSADILDHFAPKAQAPSGVLRGAAHGASEVVEGVKETGKRVLGIGPGRTKEDAGYVPADVFKPSVSGYGQIIAQSAPGLMTDVGAGAAGARIGKAFGGKGALLGALIGAGLSGFTRTAGDTVKEATVARTGDANAEQTTGDTARGVATAAAANAAGALLPTRFIPGMNNVTGAGAKGVVEAGKRFLGTTALGGAGSGLSDVITQAGTTVGTDKGLTVDPERALRATAEGALTAGTLSAPKAATDAGRAAGMAKFGGENEAASHALATRLEKNAEKGLGTDWFGKRDAEAFNTTTDHLKTELKTATKNIDGLSPDANNALEAVTSGKRITAKEVSLLERETASHPDGANAAFLARQMFVAQQLQKRGSYSEGQWSGGLSGAMDSRISRMLNPLVVGTGVGGTLLGAHFAGMMSPAFLGGAAGLYAGARVLDSATGMRSPAATFAQHFADRQAQVRLPQTTPQAAPQQPQGGAMGPWGPKPLAQQSVPQVNPNAPRPDPQADANYKAMVQQAFSENDQRDATYKANVEQAFSENAARNAALLNATKQDNANFKVNVAQATSENKARDMLAAQALKQDNANFKVNQVQAESENKARDADYRANRTQAESVNKNLNADFRANQVQAESENRDLTRAADDAVKAEAKAAKDERTASEKAQEKAEKAAKAAETALAKAALAKARVEQQAAKDAAKVEAAKVKAAAAAVKAARITKSKGGQPKVEDPRAAAMAAAIRDAQPTQAKVSKAAGEEKPEATSERKPFTPAEPHERYKRGTIDEFVNDYFEAHKKPGYTEKQHARYKSLIRGDEKSRREVTDALTKEFPRYKSSFEGLHDELRLAGGNRERALDAIEHYAQHVPDDVAAAMRKAY